MNYGYRVDDRLWNSVLLFLIQKIYTDQLVCGREWLVPLTCFLGLICLHKLPRIDILRHILIVKLSLSLLPWYSRYDVERRNYIILDHNNASFEQQCSGIFMDYFRSSLPYHLAAIFTARFPRDTVSWFCDAVRILYILQINAIQFLIPFLFALNESSFMVLFTDNSALKLF